jgi:transposase InsO family protein
MVRDMPRIEHPEQLCDVCLAGKQRRATFPQVARFRAMTPLRLVHGDLCGPISPVTQGGRQYFLLLVDDHSRLMWLTLLCTKDEAAEAIRRFMVAAEMESGQRLCMLQIDRGGEFTSTEFAAYCADREMGRHLTAPYSP